MRTSKRRTLRRSTSTRWTLTRRTSSRSASTRTLTRKTSTEYRCKFRYLRELVAFRMSRVSDRISVIQFLEWLDIRPAGYPAKSVSGTSRLKTKLLRQFKNKNKNLFY